MVNVKLDTIRKIACLDREEIWDKAGGAGHEPKIYLHWSAGHYGQFFNDYHINIDKNGELYISTNDFAETLSHTWRRNTGSIGVSLCCGFGANTNDLGDEPPTEEQIEAMSRVIAVLCDELWLTIDKKHVMTHGEAADNEDGLYCHDPYGVKNTCERWDLEYLGTTESPSYNPWATNGSRGGDVLRGKANWYRDYWKENK